METISFEELKDLYNDHPYTPYAEFLRTNEWLTKREQILIRDNFKCQKCNKARTVDHYDEKLRKNFHLWFGEEEWIRIDNSLDKVLVPKITISDKPYHLEIHHKLYIEDRLPWNYDDGDLITLCNWCHKEFHKNNDVELYAKDGLSKIRLDVCKRCNGTGWFREYRHIQNGVCFECGGKKFNQVIIKHL
jgi:5-methylcytosine-specific restriction endonuclease McrA